MEGWTGKSEEGSDSNVWLFDTASSAKDILIQDGEVPVHPQLGKEYWAVRVTGEKANQTWDVYVRFVKEAPKYITPNRAK